MNRRSLNKLHEALQAAWNSPQTESDLRKLAQSAGRRERPGGNHPMWVSDHFPSHRPVPIGRHGGNPTYPPYARKVVLEALELDAAAWEKRLAEEKALDEE